MLWSIWIGLTKTVQYEKYYHSKNKCGMNELDVTTWTLILNNYVFLCSLTVIIADYDSGGVERLHIQ